MVKSYSGVLIVVGFFKSFLDDSKATTTTRDPVQCNWEENAPRKLPARPIIIALLFLFFSFQLASKIFNS